MRSSLPFLFFSFFAFFPSHIHKHITDLLKKLVYKKITFIRPTSPACLYYTMPIYFIDITYVHFELKEAGWPEYHLHANLISLHSAFRSL